MITANHLSTGAASSVVWIKAATNRPSIYTAFPLGVTGANHRSQSQEPITGANPRSQSQEPIPANIVREAGTTWTGCQSIPASTYRDKQSFTLTFTMVNLESPLNPISPCVWTVGGSWSTQRKPIQTQGDRANSKQKDPGIQTQNRLAMRRQSKPLFHPTL